MPEPEAPEAPGPAPRLRPLGIGELLDVSLKICFAHWRTLLKAVLFVVVPCQLVIAVINLSTLPEGGDGEDLFWGPEELGDEDTAAFFGGQAASVAINVVLLLIAFGVCFRIVAEAYVGNQPDWRASLKLAARRALPLLWLSIVYTLGTLLGFVALIIPGIYLTVAWALAYPAIYVEDVRGAKALGRSRRLVKGRWWPTMGALLIGWVMATVLGFVGTFAFGLLLFIDSESILFGFAMLTLGGIVGSAIGTPVQAAILSVVYFDLRVRKEGFDLELLARGIGTDPGPTPAVRGFAPPVAEPAGGGDGERPPYWPPPPGWRPSGQA